MKTVVTWLFERREETSHDIEVEEDGCWACLFVQEYIKGQGADYVQSNLGLRRVIVFNGIIYCEEVTEEQARKEIACLSPN